MYIIENMTEFHLESPGAVAIGKFDGIHLGHQKLIHKIIEEKKKGRLATVFTFDTSASAFFGGEEKELTVKAEKRAVFEKMGIDVLIEFPLNPKTAATEPVEFVRKYLVGQMKTAYICAGTDLSFGRGGAGNYELLRQYADVCGYQVELIDKVKVDGEEVSSSRVREAVRSGQMEAATRMLGAPYSVSGSVEHGRKFGRTIGMPTANLVPDQDKLLPPNGVYYSKVLVGEKSYRGVTNIGCKPTVSDLQVMGVESYLYDFEDTIYGKDITVQLLKFRRPEMKFDGVDSLKAQMQKEIAAGQSSQDVADAMCGRYFDE